MPCLHPYLQCALDLIQPRAQRTNRTADCRSAWLHACSKGPGWNGKIGDTIMARSGSTRSGTFKAGSSSSRTPNVRKSSGSSRSEEQIGAKRTVTRNMSDREANATKIDWAKVDHTSDAEITRHMREDDTPSPSDREWQRMLNDGRVKLVTPERVDVRAIRAKLKLSQSEFAARFGFTPAAVRQWEQGRRNPHGPARVLLTIIDREPSAVSRALKPEK